MFAPKNIRLAGAFEKFGWDSAKPKKIRRRRGMPKNSARQLRGLDYTLISVKIGQHLPKLCTNVFWCFLCLTVIITSYNVHRFT